MTNEEKLELNSIMTDFINEIVKEPLLVSWPSGFGKGIGYFQINDENYEIVFDEADSNSNKIRGMKFFRTKGDLRMTRYVASKEPFAVVATIKEQVQKYIEHFKPDVFGYMCTLDETARLRHYQRMLINLESKFKMYKTSYSTDFSGERMFVLSKFDSDRTQHVLKDLIIELGKA